MTVKEMKELHLAGMADDEVIACILWGREDVKGYAEKQDEEITDDEADEILETIDGHKDCEIGITWMTIEQTTDEFIAERKEDEEALEEEDAEYNNRVK